MPYDQLMDGVNIVFADGSRLLDATILTAVVGTAGADTLTSGTGDDVFATEGGNDTIDAGSGADTVLAGSGDDVVLQSSGDDFANRGAGDDSLYGGAGDDMLMGGSGDDKLYGGQGVDALYGDGGSDYLSGGGENDMLSGADGDDKLLGGSGDDVIYGNKQADTINGGLGTDTLYGGQDDDVIIDGGGDDLIYGNLGNDPLSGGSGDDTLYGGQGNDRLVGNLGVDLINGNRGSDIIIGGGGADTFVLTPGTGSDVDIIMDFSADDSLLVKRTNVYANMTQVGTDVRVSLTSGDTVLFKNNLVADLEPWLAPHYGSVLKSGGVLSLRPETSNEFAAAPDVIPLPDGGFMLLINRKDPDGFAMERWALDDKDILALRFDADGKAVAAPTFITSGTVGSPYLTGADGLANGGFAAAWGEYTFTTDAAGSKIVDEISLRAQIFDETGAELGAEIIIPEQPEYLSQHSAEVVGLADGTFLVIWETESRTTDGVLTHGIWAQRYGPGGAVKGDIFQLAHIPGHEPWQIDYEALPNGGVVVLWGDMTWREHEYVGFGLSIERLLGQVFAANGAPMGTKFVLGDSGAGWADAEPLSSGGFVVVTDWSNSADSLGLEGQRYDGKGNPVGDSFIVLDPHETTTGYVQTLEDVVGLDDGGFLVTWTEREFVVDPLSPLFDPTAYPIYDEDLFGRRFDARGNALGEKFLISRNVDEVAYMNDADLLSDGRSIHVWTDREADFTTSINGQIFDVYDGGIW